MTAQTFREFLDVHRLRAAPLGCHIDGFAAELAARGYARPTVKQKVRQVADLGRWMERHHLDVGDVNEALGTRFLQHRRRHGLVIRSHPPTLRALVSHLRAAGVVGPAIPARGHKRTQLELIEAGFDSFLTRERGLCTATRINYLPEVRRFLRASFGRRPVVLRKVRPRHIARFIQREARRVSIGRAKLTVTALRAFFGWLRLRGEVETDLAACVPAVARWRLATLPKAIPAEQVERLLRGCERARITGRRDYAILLLLARLGLRAGEVVAMELEDVDWDLGEVVVRGKGGRCDRLPLPLEVGQALAAYLRDGRPRCSTRRVFIRSHAPWRGFTSSVAICDIVDSALQRAGLHPPRKGAHLLRHALACTMLRRGASLAEIGEVLRHRSADTTAIYAKVDVRSLQGLALAWPSVGGAR